MDIRETLAFEFTNEFLIIVHTAVEPADDDWQAMVDHAYTHEVLRGTLVVAPGAKPNPTMRSDIQNLHEHFGTLTAVITESKVSKGVMTALSWFNVPIKGFLPTQLANALAYLGRPELLSHVERVLRPYLEAPRRTG